METQSTQHRLTRSVASCCLGILIGVFIGETVGSMLIEITISEPIAILFGVCYAIMFLLTLVLQCQHSITWIRRAVLAALTIVYLLGTIFSFILDNSLDSSLSQAGRIFAYLFITLSLVLTYVIGLIELTNLDIWSKISPDYTQHKIFSTRTQMMNIFIGGVFMALVLALLFAAVDVAEDDSTHKVYKLNLLYALPLSGVIGGFLGFTNEWIRSSETHLSSYQWAQDPSTTDEL